MGSGKEKMAPSRATAAASTTKTPSSFRYCEGSPQWDPASYAADRELHARAAAHLARDDFAAAITESFALPPPTADPYVYHAIGSVTLPQVQHIIGLGSANGLHAWYLEDEDEAKDGAKDGAKDDDGKGDEKQQQQQQQKAGAQPPPPKALPSPPRPDIDTYVQIFDPRTVTANVLKTFSLNAKKGSIRARVAAHLLARRFLHPALGAALQVPKVKNPAAGLPANPYLDFQAWACGALGWAGPCDASERVRSSHHVLPVLMHHFGCACPSHEALALLRTLADGRPVWDIGSGNGYWTFMLRAYGLPGGVVPVDNAQSSWRVTWVPDTVVSDGVAFFNRPGNAGGRDAVLLLVYPIVGGGVAGGRPGGFTRDLVRAYKGDTLAVVGTQNHNGYTGFPDATMDEYMEREHAGEWTKVVQVPLPSFPGKDEALFVFQRGDRAPKADKAEST